MRCHACDKEMNDKEIQWSDELQGWEVCPVCLEIALDAAYSDGFHTEEDEYVIIDDAILHGDSSDIYSPAWKEYSE